jgi:hypothetical protein
VSGMSYHVHVGNWWELLIDLGSVVLHIYHFCLSDWNCDAITHFQFQVIAVPILIQADRRNQLNMTRPAHIQSKSSMIAHWLQFLLLNQQC